MYIDLNKFNKEVEVGKLLLDFESHKRASGAKAFSRVKYQKVFTVLLSNLVDCSLGQKLFVSLASGFKIPKRYNRLGISYHTFREALNYLKRCGFVVINVGKKGVSNTSIEATVKLHDSYPYEFSSFSEDSEYVVLKDENKKLKDYKESRYTRASRIVLKSYNKLLDRTDVFLRDNKICNQYYRIFNGDFSHGGRYYRAGVLNLKSKDRLNLTINDESVVEIDFSCMNIAILFGVLGLDLKYDPYGFSEDREAAKLTILAAMASNDFNSARKALQYEILKGGLNKSHNAKKLLLDAEKHNSLIDEYFYKGSALKTMFFESEIMTDIIASCVNKNIPILAIHDGVVCQESKAEEVVDFMSRAFFDYFSKVKQIKMTIENKDGKEILTQHKD